MLTFTLEEAAALLHMSPAVLCRKAREGSIRAAKPGKRWVFLEEDLVSYLHSLYSGPGQAPLSDCKEDTLWHSSNAVMSGGSDSSHPMDGEYAARLGLATRNRPGNTMTGSKLNSGEFTGSAKSQGGRGRKRSSAG
ncbi:MAG: multidrug DMT transporter permease [Porticoccus sp.]|nr:MAG: multidrug DMT transporter permease [Porticoccus sp.]